MTSDGGLDMTSNERIGQRWKDWTWLAMERLDMTSDGMPENLLYVEHPGMDRPVLGHRHGVSLAPHRTPLVISHTEHIAAAPLKRCHYDSRHSCFNNCSVTWRVERSIKCQLPDSTPIILCIGILKRRESECGTVPSDTGTADVPFSLPVPTYVCTHCTVVPIFLNILFFVQAPTFLVTFFWRHLIKF